MAVAVGDFRRARLTPELLRDECAQPVSHLAAIEDRAGFPGDGHVVRESALPEPEEADDAEPQNRTAQTIAQQPVPRAGNQPARDDGEDIIYRQPEVVVCVASV